jgi:hypothetical protein
VFLSRLPVLLVAIAAGVLAQTPAEREVNQARQHLEQVRHLVAEQVAPEVQLKDAEEAVADALDRVQVERVLNAADLTEAETEKVLEASERRVERRRLKLEAAKKIVEQGAASLQSLADPQADFDRARQEREIAASHVQFVKELAELVRAEEEPYNEPAHNTGPLPDRFDGSEHIPTPRQVQELELAFAAKFGKELPVSARGETAVHRAMGFDHHDRIDVALYPDDPEGVWLRRYLVNANIPYFSFRHYVPGRATGAHIHVGPQSTRVSRGVLATGSGF